MTLISPSELGHYWSGELLAANALIALNLLGALALGMLVGYERSYNGRAAGMRTYGLVCMASTALTVFVGYSHLWFGPEGAVMPPDATRVVQGIVTGIGFLCGGLILKDGLSISGLTSAASLWTASTIGVLLGVGFYAAALTLALLCTLSMTWLMRLERRLPARSTMGVSLTFRVDSVPDEEFVSRLATEQGYVPLWDTLAITVESGQINWKFNVISREKMKSPSPARLAQALLADSQIASFQLTPARN